MHLQSSSGDFARQNIPLAPERNASMTKSFSHESNKTMSGRLGYLEWISRIAWRPLSAPSCNDPEITAMSASTLAREACSSWEEVTEAAIENLYGEVFNTFE